jgi:hypothetical protein
MVVAASAGRSQIRLVKCSVSWGIGCGSGPYCRIGSNPVFVQTVAPLGARGACGSAAGDQEVRETGLPRFPRDGKHRRGWGTEGRFPGGSAPRAERQTRLKLREGPGARVGRLLAIMSTHH